jgi:hypothetical protein
MSVALRAHIAPETYAKRKREMHADQDAWVLKLAHLNDATMARAAFYQEGRAYARCWRRTRPRPGSTRDPRFLPKAYHPPGVNDSLTACLTITSNAATASCLELGIAPWGLPGFSGR